MPKNLLIVYRHLIDHKDPDYGALVYGDSGWRARKIKETLTKGSYVFFHTTKFGERYITGYYYVKAILPPKKAKQLRISADAVEDDDIILLGNKSKSRIDFFLPFNKSLAQKFKDIEFRFPRRQTELSSISSHTRNFREISKRDKKMLLQQIEKHSKKIKKPDMITFDEAHKLKERPIQDILYNNLAPFGQGFKPYDYEVSLNSKESSMRADLIVRRRNEFLIIEVKKPNNTPKSVIRQIKKYVTAFKKHKPQYKVTGCIVVDYNTISTRLIQKTKKEGVLLFGYGLSLKLLDLTKTNKAP